jgi:ankyrin repeat protein
MKMHKSAVPLLIVLILCCGISSSFGQNVSDEARRYFDRGLAAVEKAKAPVDYEAAIEEFEQAARLAPDWPEVYYNLGLIQEKAEKYGDAVKNLRQYLMLVPDASDAESVKSLINKLEYMAEKEAGVKKVYEMMTMTSDSFEKDEYQRKLIEKRKLSGLDDPVPLSRYRMVSGEMQVRNMWYVFDKEGMGVKDQLGVKKKVHPPIPREWEPVKVNGRFYEYAYSHYSMIGWGYVARYDQEVKGEVLSIDPPRIKETADYSVTWATPIEKNPHPFNDYGGASEYIYELVADNPGVTAKKPVVNAQNQYGWTPLEWAIIKKSKDEVESIIAQGADINAKNKDGDTPLHWAVSGDNKEIAELLIAKGADINAKNKYGDTPLSRAVSSNNKDVAELLTAKGADINAKDDYDNTPLDLAIRSNSKDIAGLLVANGADIDALDKYGDTKLRRALIEGRKEEAELLIALGASLKAANLNAVNDGGYTPLSMAITRDEKDVIELLIAKGADINAKNTYDDQTPLHSAVFQGKKEMAELLIAKGADLNARERYQKTPLHLAAAGGHKDLAALLIAKGADIRAKDNNGQTPLFFAANAEIAALLIGQGADLNAKDNFGDTPLHGAAMNGRKETAELLIAKGADINAKDNEGKTALQVAESKNFKEIADLLRKHGAR